MQTESWSAHEIKGCWKRPLLNSGLFCEPQKPITQGRYNKACAHHVRFGFIDVVNFGEKHGMGILDVWIVLILDILMMIAFDLAQWNKCKMAKAKRGQSTEEWDFNESQVYQPSSRFKEVI